MIRVAILVLALATAFGPRDGTIQKAPTLSGKITGWFTFTPATRTVPVNGAGVGLNFHATNHHHAK